MKLELEKQLPDGYELASESPESIVLDGDKSHVIVRYAVKPIDETNQDNQDNDWLKKAKHLANNYAHVYSFVGGDDMPRAQQALFDHLESIVKPIDDPHAELKKQYERDFETCSEIDDLPPWHLWQVKVRHLTDWNLIKPTGDLNFFANHDYRRHPHADSIIDYHKCSDDDKRRWQYQCRDAWINCDGEPDWYEHTPAFRLKPRVISVTLQNGDLLEFPEPVREPLEDGDIFWFKPFSMKISSDFWHNTKGDLQLLADNRVFLTQADCQAVQDAIQAILSQ